MYESKHGEFINWISIIILKRFASYVYYCILQMSLKKDSDMNRARIGAEFYKLIEPYKFRIARISSMLNLNIAMCIGLLKYKTA